MGDKRIGIAVSDLSQKIASPHTLYERRNTRKDLGTIANLCQTEKAAGVVFGLPKGLDGEENEHCQRIRLFADKLLKKHPLPVFFQDERFSTEAVNRALRETNMTRKQRESLDDKMAAAYILQTVLDGFEHLESA